PKRKRGLSPFHEGEQVGARGFEVALVEGDALGLAFRAVPGLEAQALLPRPGRSAREREGMLGEVHLRVRLRERIVQLEAVVGRELEGILEAEKRHAIRRAEDRRA